MSSLSQTREMLPLVTYTIKYYQLMYPHVSPPTAHQYVSMCIKPICTELDHLEVYSWNRTGIPNVPEGFLCYFNEGPSPVVYMSILELLLVVLNGCNT